MKNILIIGCGLLGSSLVRKISKKKISKKIFIYEKSKKNIEKIKKLKLKGTIVKKLKDVVPHTGFIIFCTPMSEYKKIILKINDYLSSDHIITDIGSAKLKSNEIIRKNLKKKYSGLQATLLPGLRLVGLKMGKKIYSKINGVF